MNDRLDLSRLAAGTASFPPYFEALADETTWSYLTRAMLLAGFNDSRRMLTEALFSKPRLLISQPFHPGLGRFADHLRLSGGLDEVVRRHAMLQFYAPFVGVELFECVKEKLGGERASGVDCQLCSDLWGGLLSLASPRGALPTMRRTPRRSRWRARRGARSQDPGGPDRRGHVCGGIAQRIGAAAACRNS
jgi:hypothetical protein